MQYRIREHVEELFEDTPPTKKAVELQEEMIQNLNDKYNDLVSGGKTPEAAYNITVAGIGDIGGLLSQVQSESIEMEEYMVENEMGRQKSALFTAVSVMLYILSPLALIVMAIFGSGNVARVGIPVMFVMVALATGLLIYNSMTKPKYYKKDDTMVEEFREWQADTQGKRGLRKAISSALWTVIVCAYFVISFLTFAWHVTWIIFLVGAAIEAFINIAYTIKK
ncbi:MAG: permease prefix domain 1-containing protein [Oscillospiraceae bacterium]|nr:permease prefix domain 1-containing protein [Oscillospiraceae bacterium]